MALMLTDPIAELEARGEDPDDVIARNAEWLKKLENAGLKDFWLAAFGNASTEPEQPEEPNND